MAWRLKAKVSYYMRFIFWHCKCTISFGFFGFNFNTYLLLLELLTLPTFVCIQIHAPITDYYIVIIVKKIKNQIVWNHKEDIIRKITSGKTEPKFINKWNFVTDRIIIQNIPKTTRCWFCSIRIDILNYLLLNIFCRISYFISTLYYVTDQGPARNT